MGDMKFDLSNPKHLRVVMARGGIHPDNLRLWWSPDLDGDVNPLDNPEVQATVRHFLGQLWLACLDAEAAHCRNRLATIEEETSDG